MCRACLHRETCRFFSACRREIPRLSLRGESLRRWSCGARFTVLRVTTRIINGVTTSSDDIYIYNRVRDDLYSWALGWGRRIYYIFNFKRLKEKVEYLWRILARTWFFHEWQKYIPLFLRVYGNIPSIIVNIICIFFFIFKTKRRGTNGDNRSNCQDGTFVYRLNRKANVTENQVIR